MLMGIRFYSVTLYEQKGDLSLSIISSPVHIYLSFDVNLIKL
jgi:hypothetical protein